MAEFVRAQIFGTTFEITSRYLSPRSRTLRRDCAMLTLEQIHRPTTRGNGSLWPCLVICLPFNATLLSLMPGLA